MIYYSRSSIKHALERAYIQTMINLDDLVLGDLKAIKALIGTGNTAVTPSTHPAIGKHCVIRTFSAGVHTGTVVSVDGKCVELAGSRRIWSWQGALSLSEVATEGINPSGSRVACVVPSIFLTEAIEIIPTSEKSRAQLEKCNSGS